MDSGIHEGWGAAVAIGWLLSPVAIIVGAVAIVALVEGVRSSFRRLRRSSYATEPGNV